MPRKSANKVSPLEFSLHRASCGASTSGSRHRLGEKKPYAVTAGGSRVRHVSTLHSTPRHTLGDVAAGEKTLLHNQTRQPSRDFPVCRSISLRMVSTYHATATIKIEHALHHTSPPGWYLQPHVYRCHSLCEGFDLAGVHISSLPDHRILMWELTGRQHEG